MNAEKRQQAIRRMKELSGILKEASRAYYAEDREIMSNLEYDALYDELVKLEEETQMVLAGSATTTVGYEAVDELPKEAHESPMLSLDKTKDREVLRGFIGGSQNTALLENGWPDRGSHLLSGKIAKSSNPWEWSSW